jgi:diguanylate cyclase (GGDEF)-like protein
MTPFDDSHRPSRAVAVAGAIALLGTVLTWFLVWTEINNGDIDVDVSVFAVMAALLLLSERVPATWIRFGPIGVVTPSGLFAFALLLLGSPSLAVGVAVLGATWHAVSQNGSVLAVIVTVAGRAMALSTGGLMLFAVGVRGPITRFDTVPWEWAAAIVATGASILVLNSFVAAIWMAARRRSSFVGLLKRGLAARITAEGAFLSLAPIWVIGTGFSLVLAPLLGITTVLVFRSTRQALERAHDARHDPLTGLQNKRAFVEQVDDDLLDIQVGSRPAVLVMDLNGFKEINDRLGHQLGDALLISFADRLESSAGQASTSARLGGDEFAVHLIAGSSDESLHAAVAELHAKLSRPLRIEGFPVRIGVSIGVAVAPDDGSTADDLLKAADVAMYKAKRTSSAVEYYGNCVREPQHGRHNLLTELGEALTDHQFFIDYQPQLRISDGGVDTVEALIRWQHPTYGLISPGEFIGLAEQTDFIGPLTERVLRMATQGLMTGAAADLRLAVNVSAQSLQDAGFANQVFAVLAESGFEPTRLELEVTERSLVTKAERTSYAIAKLRDAGVRIAIDDFGVGYSSYQTLRTLEVDRVKIDRDFVGGVLTSARDRTIVASLITLAHDLGLDVVAEGVESTAVWEALDELHCDVAQGFGIAVPMAYPELRAWLADWNQITGSEDRVTA